MNRKTIEQIKSLTGKTRVPDDAEFYLPKNESFYKHSGSYMSYWGCVSTQWQVTAVTINDLKQHTDLTEVIKVKGKTVDDIEVGMFLKCPTAHWLVTHREDNIISLSTVSRSKKVNTTWVETFKNSMWTYSYSYNGIYTHFVDKETAQESKIKELQATINEAKKQIDELSKK